MKLAAGPSLFKSRPTNPVRPRPAQKPKNQPLPKPKPGSKPDPGPRGGSKPKTEPKPDIEPPRTPAEVNTGMILPKGRRSKVVPKDRAAQFALAYARARVDLQRDGAIGDGRATQRLADRCNNLAEQFNTDSWTLEQTPGTVVNPPPVNTRTGREKPRKLPPVRYKS